MPQIARRRILTVKKYTLAVIIALLVAAFLLLAPVVPATGSAIDCSPYDSLPARVSISYYASGFGEVGYQSLVHFQPGVEVVWHYGCQTTGIIPHYA